MATPVHLKNADESVFNWQLSGWMREGAHGIEPNRTPRFLGIQGEALLVVRVRAGIGWRFSERHNVLFPSRLPAFSAYDIQSVGLNVAFITSVQSRQVFQRKPHLYEAPAVNPC